MAAQQFKILLTLATLIFSTNSDDSTQDPKVFTTFGVIQGFTKHLDIQPEFTNTSYVNCFLGIPYAEPPLNELRFRKPVQSKPWYGVREAKYVRSACLQDGNPFQQVQLNEDCLYLNIWTPKYLEENFHGVLLPVMVYVHGGSYAIGSGSFPSSDGSILAAVGGVIVVSFNYRLGPFGFMYLDDDECPGNMGMMDFELALRWVQLNIGRFGGDSNCVTIFGQSSGGAMTGLFLLNQVQTGLFHRVIMQSGTPYSNWAAYIKDTNSTQEISMAILENSSCGVKDTLSEAMSCLRQLDRMDIIKIASNFESLRPVVVKKPELMQIVQTETKVLMGTVVDDAYYLVSSLETEPDIFHAFAVEAFGDIEPEIETNLKNLYLKPNTSILQGTVDLATDFMFNCGTIKMAEELSNNGVQVYVYELNHRPEVIVRPDDINAIHGDDLFYIFGTFLENGFESAEHEIKFGKQMMDYWTNFARYGNPNEGVKQETKWPVFNSKDKCTFILDSPSNTRNGFIREDQCTYVTSIMN